MSSPRVPSKNVSQFGPAVRPAATANIYTKIQICIYMSKELYYIDCDVPTISKLNLKTMYKTCS